MANTARTLDTDDYQTVTMSVKLPAKLRKRAGKIAKQMRTSTTALIIEGLTIKVEAFEAKQRLEEEMLRREQEEARISRRQNLSLVDPASLAPSLTKLEPTNEELRVDPTNDEDKSALSDEVYLSEAEKIFNVLADPIERRIAAHTAVKTIREHKRLDNPDDRTILRRLDKIIAKLQATRPIPEPPGLATTAFADPPAPTAPPATTILGQFFGGLQRKPDK